MDQEDFRDKTVCANEKDLLRSRNYNVAVKNTRMLGNIPKSAVQVTNCNILPSIYTYF